MVSKKSTDTHSLVSLVAELEAYMDACASIDQFCGAVSLCLQGKELLSRAYGMADLEHRVLNTVKTKFRLGSITKPITAMAIYMLEEQGQLCVADPISKYLSEAPKHWENISIHHLLTHRSGLTNFTDFPDYAGTQRLPTTAWQTMNRFKEMPLVAAPGEISRYNNSGYIVLGAIIEIVSGNNYADFLQEKIFRPLRMYDSGYDCAETVLENRARGYVRSKQSVLNASYLDMSIPFAAGALYSTIDDLFLLDQAILKGKKPVPWKVTQTMSGHVADDSYSCGWHVDNSQGRLKVGHSGGIDGFCTIMLRFPHEKMTIVVLSNLVSWLNSPERIAQDLSSIVFKEPYEIPRIRKAIKLDSERYDDYTGMYELEDLDLHLLVSKEQDRWMLQFTDQPPFEIFPESEIDFFVLDFEAQIKFCLNSRKEVTHIILVHDGQATRAYKLK